VKRREQTGVLTRGTETVKTGVGTETGRGIRTESRGGTEEILILNT
jgi:hypothetical protein